MPFYKRRWFWVVVAVVAVPVLAAAWWLGSPLFIDRVVDEDFPMSASAIVPDDMSQADVEAEMEEAAGLVETAAEPMPTAGPTGLLTGSFRDADDFHQGSGSATIYELDDGSRVLRFEDFEVTNGPDLHVIITPSPDPMSRDDVTAGGYIDVGGLKGNVGSQNYEIPGDFDLAEAGSVVIYCVPFHVLFAVAPLQSS